MIQCALGCAIVQGSLWGHALCVDGEKKKEEKSDKKNIKYKKWKKMEKKKREWFKNGPISR